MASVALAIRSSGPRRSPPKIVGVVRYSRPEHRASADEDVAEREAMRSGLESAPR